MSNRYGEKDHLPIEYDDEDAQESPLLSGDFYSEEQIGLPLIFHTHA